MMMIYSYKKAAFPTQRQTDLYIRVSVNERKSAQAYLENDVFRRSVR